MHTFNKVYNIHYLKMITILLCVIFFHVIKVNAYYQKDVINSQIISTTSFQNLETATDNTKYGFCNKNAIILLTVGNNNNYNVGYSIMFDNTDLMYTIDGVLPTNYTLTAGGSKTHTIVVSGTTTTTNLSITVSTNNPYSASVTEIVSFDTICPVCSWGTLNNLTSTLTETYDITCTDLSGMTYTTLTTSSFTSSNTSIANIINVSGPTTVTNGYKYTVTALGGSVGTFTLSLNANVIKDSFQNSNEATTSQNIGVIKRNPTMTVSNSSLNQNYGGSASSVTYTYSGDAIPTVSANNSNVTVGIDTISKTITITPISAGSSIVTLQAAETNKYNAISKVINITIAPITVTYTSGSASKPYDGTPLTESECTLTGGSLLTGHIATCTNSGSITVVGSATNTLSAVTIKDSYNNDVTNNYTITKINGTLDVSIGILNGGAVTIIGSNLVNNTLTAVITNTTPAASYTYAWFYSDSAGTGGTQVGTSSTLTLTNNMIGKYVYVVVTASKNYYEIKQFSDVTDVDNNSFQIVNTSVTYTRTFNANGSTITHNGSSSTSSITVSCTATGTTTSDSCIITTPTIARSGYSIFKWGNTSSSPSVTYDVNSPITLNASTSGQTVYAIAQYACQTGTDIRKISTVTSGDGLYVDPWDSSRYIYRGANPNNYVTFNGETWRIISIESDGKIKIALATPLAEATYNSSSSNLNWASSQLYTYLNGTYYNSLSQSNYIESGTWKAGIVSYGASSTGKTIADTVTLENSISVSAKVGMPMTTDYLKASLSCNSSTTWNVLNNSPYVCKNNNWLFNSTNDYWFINPYSATRARFRNTTGAVSLNPSNYTYGVMPVVYLKADTLLYGSGTASNPYTINAQCGRLLVTNATCTITATTTSYSPSQTLTINVNPNGATINSYSWDNVNYSGTNTKNVTSSGTYKAYIKDTNGGIGSCNIAVASRTEYRYQNCLNTNKLFGNWYHHSYGYSQSYLVAYSKASAEYEYATWYRTVITWSRAGSTSCGRVGMTMPCYEYNEYSRSVSCNSWAGSTWTGWSTTTATASSIRQVETRTTYAPV